MLVTHRIELGQDSHVTFNKAYILRIALVAALGGLLFGYDLVVIGGAKPFYQLYFHITSESMIGWANSCALLGCFFGSVISGYASEKFGRRFVLVASALLFAVSSVFTGWSFQFIAFIAWRILGGLAIGLTSNASPTYIAEVSPSSIRGRLVSLNQLALVLGILVAQITNYLIAARHPIVQGSALEWSSWNVQFGWRWMFTAVAVPAMVFLMTAPFLPETPRWLVARGRLLPALAVLERLGGQDYARTESVAIENSVRSNPATAGWLQLTRPGLRKLLLIGIGLAFLQQWSAINIFFNYAEEVFRSAGYGVNDVLFNIIVTGAVNLVFTIAMMMLVDRVGRRKLMIGGCIGIGAAHLLAAAAYRSHVSGAPVLVLTLFAIACYAMTLAPVTWVVIVELFPNAVRARALSIAIGALWIASFLLTYTFPLIAHRSGMPGAFLLYGLICIGGAVFTYFLVPETGGRSLEEIELSLTDTSTVKFH